MRGPWGRRGRQNVHTTINQLDPGHSPFCSAPRNRLGFGLLQTPREGLKGHGTWFAGRSDVPAHTKGKPGIRWGEGGAVGWKVGMETFWGQKYWPGRMIEVGKLDALRGEDGALFGCLW